MKLKNEIMKKIVELDREYAEYQKLHRRFHMVEDEKAKLIYNHLTEAYKDILYNILGG